MIDRRKVKGTILQRKNYDYTRHNELRVTPYEYVDRSCPAQGGDLQQTPPNAGSSNPDPVANSWIAARDLGAKSDDGNVQHSNAPLAQNTWNGQRIRGLRKRLHLSARKFGHLLGFPGKNCHITIYRHETDKIKPSIQTVMILEQLEKSVPQA
jgi:DNA-binding transcriptional regulator YiaG